MLVSGPGLRIFLGGTDFNRESSSPSPPLQSNIMRWPWSTNSERDSDDKKSSVPWTESLNATDWRHYTDPRTVIPTILLTSTILVSVSVYRSYLRRIPAASYIRPKFFRKRSLFGRVTSVGDADNFHLFHTPGGRLTGWGWLPGRKQIPEKKALKNNTVCPYIPCTESTKLITQRYIFGLQE